MNIFRVKFFYFFTEQCLCQEFWIWYGIEPETIKNIDQLININVSNLCKEIFNYIWPNETKQTNFPLNFIGDKKPSFEDAYSGNQAVIISSIIMDFQTGLGREELEKESIAFSWNRPIPHMVLAINFLGWYRSLLHLKNWLIFYRKLAKFEQPSKSQNFCQDMRFCWKEKAGAL